MLSFYCPAFGGGASHSQGTNILLLGLVSSISSLTSDQIVGSRHAESVCVCEEFKVAALPNTFVHIFFPIIIIIIYLLLLLLLNFFCQLSGTILQFQLLTHFSGHLA